MITWVLNTAGATEELMQRMYHFGLLHLFSRAGATGEHNGRDTGKPNWEWYLEGHVGAYVAMANLEDDLLCMLNNGEPRDLWKVKELLPHQEAPLVSCCTRSRSSLTAKRHPQIMSEEMVGLYTLCHMMDGKKLIHYVTHAKGANLSTQSQFLRGASGHEDVQGEARKVPACRVLA